MASKHHAPLCVGFDRGARPSGNEGLGHFHISRARHMIEMRAEVAVGRPGQFLESRPSSLGLQALSAAMTRSQTGWWTTSSGPSTVQARRIQRPQRMIRRLVTGSASSLARLRRHRCDLDVLPLVSAFPLWFAALLTATQYFNMKGEAAASSTKPKTSVRALTIEYSRVNLRPFRQRRTASARIATIEPRIAGLMPNAKARSR
jgi:hypothetical protein